MHTKNTIFVSHNFLWGIYVSQLKRSNFFWNVIIIIENTNKLKIILKLNNNEIKKIIKILIKIVILLIKNNISKNNNNIKKKNNS